MKHFPKALTAVGAALAVAAAGLVAGSSPAAAAPATASINFQPASATVPSGYVADSGAAYTSTRGFGWYDDATKAPASMSAHTRLRTGVTGPNADLIHVQPGHVSATATPKVGYWQYCTLPTAVYDVSLGVGDATYYNSSHTVVVEGAAAVSGFVPTSTTPFKTGKVTVAVTDGCLTVRADGGRNTKLTWLKLSPTPRTVVSTNPVNGATNVSLTTSVTFQLSQPVSLTSIDRNNFQLLAPDGTVVAGNWGSDGAASLARFTPSSPLKAATTYTAKSLPALNTTQTGLLTAVGCPQGHTSGAPPGCPFTAKTISFTTGTGGSTSSSDFALACTISQPGTTNVTFSTVDNVSKLWWTGGDGTIYSQAIDPATGQCTGTRATNAAARGTLVLGMAFVPGDPCPWITRNDFPYQGAANFTGRVSKLSGTGCGSLRDVIVGLPRSYGDHMTNQIAHRASNSTMCFTQGSQNGYGAPDVNWGNRPEVPLSAALLCFSPSITGTVNVDTSKGYDPRAAGAPVTVYADGIRNAFDLVWHSNGGLYVPGNESANGNSPACPAGGAPGLTGLPAYNDYFTRVVRGGYYGHPNPSRGYCVLNGGNPTSGVDPFEVKEYPVGTQPHSAWKKPDVNLGLHRSPDGAAEHKTTRCGGIYKGDIFIAMFAGNAVDAFNIASDGTIGASTRVLSNLPGALDVAFDGSGNLAVSSFGSQADGSGGTVKVYAPKC